MSGRYAPVDNIDFDALPPQHQKKLMDDVNLYENSGAIGTSGRQQLLYQYANLSKPRGRNPLGQMESPAQPPPPAARMSNGAAPSPAQQSKSTPQQGRSAPPAFSSKLEQRWGKGEVAMEAVEPMPADEEEFVEPSPQKPAKGGTFLNRIPADLLPFYKQLVPYYPYYSDYVPEDMVHVYRKLLPYFESTSNWKTSGLSSYWKGKEKRSIKMKDDYEALKRRDQEEDILLKIGQKMRELKMKQIEDNIASQEILVEGLKKKYSSMWTDEEGVEKKLDMGMKLQVEAEPGKPVEEDPFANVPTSMATYRNFEDVMDEKFRRLMGDFGDLTVERRRLAWGGKKLKTGDEQEGMAGKGGFIGYSSGYRYRTRRAPRHGTIGYNVDSYYDVYVDDYFDEDIEAAPEVQVEAAPAAPQPVDPNLFAQDFIDFVPAIVDPVTTFKEEEFKHLDWDKDVAVYEDTYAPPEPPALSAEEGLYVMVGADGSLVTPDGAVFQVLANGTLKNAAGAVFAPTGVILSLENALVNAALAFEGAMALADGVKLDEGRRFVIKEQSLAEGEMLLSYIGGAEFVDGAGRLFRRGADGAFIGADLDNLEAYVYSGATITAQGAKRLTGELAQGSSEWKLVCQGVELERGAKVTVVLKSKAEGDVLLLKSDGTLVDGAGVVYSVTPAGLLVGPGGVVMNPTGIIMTPAGVIAQNSAVSMADGAVMANGSRVAAGSKIMVKKQKEEEEELEPPPKPVTIKGECTLRDMKGDIFAEVHKDDAAGTVIGAESVIIIKNAKGKEVVRITRGYVTVKNFNVEEIVQIMRGVVSVKTMAGKEMVHVEKGEIYIEDFDGEVIVNNLADVNKLDEEMSLKNM